ncbi:Ribonuclease P protein subunit p21 [Dispira parvispora]|uniref:Ribonuclease P protein subunit p21 n=1 Tax=Dispira parvispora TaxID=1520584 RepID=A0A9W8AS70_9FUNG|nr:Ribonuclease P protein subunit p21 [Dispira parvispora]
MGKRNVGKGKNKGERLPRSGQYLRMNFLYEASALLTSLSTVPGPLEKPATTTPLKNGLVPLEANQALNHRATTNSDRSMVTDLDQVDNVVPTVNPHNARTTENTSTRNGLGCTVYSPGKDLVPLARFYCRTMKKIAQRSVTRLDPSIKRSICQRCEALLMPGITCQPRLVRKAPRTMGFKCQVCCHQRKFVQNPAHKLFVNDPKHQVWEFPETKVPREELNPTQ